MNKVLLTAGVFFGCAAGMSMGACGGGSGSGGSSTSTSTTGTHSTSTGKTTTSSSSSSGTGMGGSSSSSTSGGGSGVGGSTGKCPSVPTLHAASAGSIYCGFNNSDAGPPDITCMTGQQCCVGGSIGGGNYANDDCEPWGTECMNPAGKGLAVPCEQPSDCMANDGGTGQICCLMGTQPAMDVMAGCTTVLKASGGTGTQCNVGTSCGNGNTQLCLSNTDCPMGMTCQPFHWKIIELGACM
jgi:hypothetical protein